MKLSLIEWSCVIGNIIAITISVDPKIVMLFLHGMETLYSTRLLLPVVQVSLVENYWFH